MRTPDHQAQQEHDNYWQAVTDMAEQIVAEVHDAGPDEDRDELLFRLLHENTDQHDYVIRDELATWSKKRLIDAIVDDKVEMVLEKAGHQHAESAAASERRRLKRLPHDVLVDRAFELVEQNNTCDNGGWAYWVDREGYHKVNLPDGEDE